MAAAIRREAAGELHVVDGHRLRLLVDGPERLEALLGLIAGAERELRLLYYIFTSEPLAQRVRDALVDACGRGVAVSLVVDGFGSQETPDTFFAPLSEAGAHVCRFLPRYGRRYLLRNHQKLAVADGRRALIGGFNIGDAYFAPPGEGWRDLALELEGEGVAALAAHQRMIEAWADNPHAKLRALSRAARRASQRRGRLRWLFGAPAQRLSPWALALRRDLRRGRRLDMMTAYFAPNPGVLRALGRLARRGPVRIVTAAKSDNAVTVAAGRHCYRRLLRRGAHILEYRPTKLHTKLYVIDDVAYLGSANFDMRSLYINLELMLRIEDDGFARRLRAHIDAEAEDCRPIDLALIRERAGWWRRLRWRAAYFLIAVMDFSVTRRVSLGAVEGELD